MNVFKVSCFLLWGEWQLHVFFRKFRSHHVKTEKIIMTEGCHSSMRLQQLRSHLNRHGLIDDQLIF